MPTKNKDSIEELKKLMSGPNREISMNLESVEQEMKHYRKHFKGKVIYLPFDDLDSKFWHYFSYNFRSLGLKRLIASKRVDQSYSLFSMHEHREKALWFEYAGETSDSRVPTAECIYTHEFNGDGSFYSKEAKELMKSADIVVSNPPFTNFIEMVEQSLSYNKQFIFIGHFVSVANNFIFEAIKDERIWLGNNAGDLTFQHSGGDDGSSNIRWFTNIEYPRRTESIVLYKKYNNEKEYYPKYDNYNAINVDQVAEIPKDYFGLIGVPITFLDDFNPEQFEVVGIQGYKDVQGNSVPEALIVDGENKFVRILIRRVKT